MRLVLGEEGRGAEVDVGLGERDERELVLLGEELGDLCVRHRSPLDQELSQAAGRDPVVAGVLLLREHRLQLVRVDEAVPQEQGAERRPRMMGGFHLFLIGRTRENLRRENLAACARSSSGCPRPRSA